VAHGVHRQKNILDDVLDVGGGRAVQTTSRNPTQQRRDVMEQLLAGARVTILCRRHQPAPLRMVVPDLCIGHAHPGAGVEYRRPCPIHPGAAMRGHA
jgi:hypothetical protein